MSRRGRWGVGAVAAMAVFLVAARLALPRVPGWFIHADPLAPCDLIVVSGSNPDGSTEAEGARLWHQGFGRSLLCVGRPAAWEVAEEEVMARHARALGVPAERVLRFHIPYGDDPDTGTTREEVRRLLPLLRARRVRSALVVTGELQSRREALLIGPWRRADIRVLVHPIESPGFSPAGWWRRKVDTKAVVGEALGWLTVPFGS
jgi:uncharacterized SAM-binding protein YcdF (DUF218 family)